MIRLGEGVRLCLLALVMCVPANAGAVSIGAPPQARAAAPAVQSIAYSPRRVAEILESRGYRNIVMTDRQLPGYEAEACFGRDSFRLRINRWGDVVNRERLGRCRDGGSADALPDDGEGPGDIRIILETRGYSDIRFIEEAGRRIVAEACRGDDRFRLELNRFGDIRDRDRIGRCSTGDDEDQSVSEAQLPRRRQRIMSILSSQGFTDIEFQGRHLFRYEVDACRDGSRYRLVLNPRGVVRRSNVTGSCREPATDDIIVDVAPPRRYERAEIRRRDRVRPEVCQEYFDWLLYERTVLFDVGSARIRPDSAELLADLAIVSSRCPETALEISGHTDSDGSYEANQRLSEQRAFAVAEFLARNGIGRDRLYPIGFGEERPVAPNTSATNKQKNRRIEISVRWEDQSAGQ